MKKVIQIGFLLSIPFMVVSPLVSNPPQKFETEKTVTDISAAQNTQNKGTLAQASDKGIDADIVEDIEKALQYAKNLWFKSPKLIRYSAYALPFFMVTAPAMVTYLVNRVQSNPETQLALNAMVDNAAENALKNLKKRLDDNDPLLQNIMSNGIKMFWAQLMSIPKNAGRTMVERVNTYFAQSYSQETVEKILFGRF